MRIIFLDIDGVLNSNAWSEYVHLHRNDFSNVYIPEWQDKNAIDMLYEFCKENEIKIVLSSSWRHHTVEETRQYLEKYDYLKKLNELIIDVTGYDASRIRGNEIKTYLEKHPEHNNYVIIDDDNDMLYEQFHRFVWINAYYGLRKGDLYNIKEIIELWESRKDL